MAHCGLEREILIFLAGGLPADSVSLEKYLNMAHYIANLLLSQATYHMWVSPYGENSSWKLTVYSLWITLILMQAIR